MHIGIVIWNLMENEGGIQRVGVNLAHAMLERGHQVSIFYHSIRNKTIPLFPVDKAVHLRRLLLPPQTESIFSAKKTLVDANLDVLVAMFSWSKFLWFPALLQNTGIPLVASEHNPPEIINTERWNAYERHACLYAADGIHLLLESFVPSLPSSLQSKVCVIKNAVFPPDAAANSEKEKSAQPVLLAAGRFVERQKQFSLLIKAFASLQERFSDWTLVLAGSGPQEKEYKKLAAHHKLKNRIKFPGMVADMASLYAASDIVCTPSRYEGFSLTSFEAQAHGLPVVGFHDCPAINELIVHNENGLLAREMTAASLAEQLAALMADTELQKRLGEKGRELTSRFSPKIIHDQWERLLIDTARRKNKTRLQEAWMAHYEDPLCADLHEILSRPLPFMHLLTPRHRMAAWVRRRLEALLAPVSSV